MTGEQIGRPPIRYGVAGLAIAWMSLAPLTSKAVEPPALSGGQSQAVANFQPMPVAPPPPQPPHGLAATKAYAVLQRACAGCHEVPRADAAPAAGGLGNILDLAALSREPSLVRPGIPDGSRLYTRALDRHIPLDIFSGSKSDDLAANDVEALRDWIKELPRGDGTCPGRTHMEASEVAGLMTSWLEQAGPDAKGTRFVSLADLYNSCASDRELVGYREAVAKLLNSLSWAPLPAHVETIGDKLALLAFRLDDIGWVPAHWDKLAAREPTGGAIATPAQVTALTGSRHAVVRGGWLASAALTPAMSAELLGLPQRLADLERLVGKPPQGAAAGLRIGVERSAESGMPRVVERFATSNGALWVASDLKAGTNARDVAAAPPGKTDLAAQPIENRRVAFSLPNGFLGFATFDAEGRRITTTGGSAHGAGQCLACHSAGLAPLPANGQPGSSLFDDDVFRYRRALVQAGVDPDRLPGGTETVAALALRYERPLDLARIAGETASDLAALTARLQSIGGAAQQAARRLLQGLLTRPEAEALLAELGPRAVAARSDPSPVPSAVAETSKSIDIGLWSDAVVKRAGDLVSFNVISNADCNLTLISIDTAGRATVIFPSEFEPDNAIRTGQQIRIPSERAPYQLRVSNKGTETAVATCSARDKLPERIVPDYEHQRFTVLGNWRAFLRGEGVEVSDAVKAATRASRRRGRTARQEPKQEAQQAMPPEPAARAAIELRVE